MSCLFLLGSLKLSFYEEQDGSLTRALNVLKVIYSKLKSGFCLISEHHHAFLVVGNSLMTLYLLITASCPYTCTVFVAEPLLD